MNTIKRSLVSMIIALLTTLSITFAAQAVSGRYTVTENPLFFWGGSYTYPSTLTASACLGGSCAYEIGTTSAVTYWRWSSTPAHTYQLWAYDPSVGESVAKYTYTDNISTWGVTVNQANTTNKTKYVYLGFSDDSTHSTGGNLILSNDCSGWTCGKKVLYDSIQYNTNP